MSFLTVGANAFQNAGLNASKGAKALNPSANQQFLISPSNIPGLSAQAPGLTSGVGGLQSAVPGLAGGVPGLNAVPGVAANQGLSYAVGGGNGLSAVQNPYGLQRGLGGLPGGFQGIPGLSAGNVGGLTQFAPGGIQQVPVQQVQHVPVQQQYVTAGMGQPQLSQQQYLNPGYGGAQAQQYRNAYY